MVSQDATGSDDRDLIIAAAREALERETERAGRLDSQARGQMTLAGNWFAVVQAVAAVALRAGTNVVWLILVGLAALAAAVCLGLAMKKSASVWKLRDRPEVGTVTIDQMRGALDTADFKDKMITEYQHLLGSFQLVNYDRALDLDKSVKPWWIALSVAMFELTLALLARIAS